jgi:hypothetical protein
MQTFLNDLLKFQEVEQQYQAQHPEAEPLSKFYAVLGLAKLLKIVDEAQGRRIVFRPDSGAGLGLAYSFE